MRTPENKFKVQRNCPSESKISFLVFFDQCFQVFHLLLLQIISYEMKFKTVAQ